jgi:hypothetical protein
MILIVDFLHFIMSKTTIKCAQIPTIRFLKYFIYVYLLIKDSRRFLQ